MNDINKLESLLEKATTRGNLTEADLDAETASLRAGWLALGELIAAAEPEAVLPKCVPVDNIAISRLQPRLPKRHHHVATVMVAMASAILVAVTIGVFTRNDDSLTDAALKATLVVNNSKTDVSTTLQSPVSTNTNENDAELAWNDTLDQEMESARLAIGQSWNDQLASTSHVDYQIESFRKELENSSL